MVKTLPSAYTIIDQVERMDADKQVRLPAIKSIGLHSNAPLKSFGSPKIPVILVQFNDKSFVKGTGKEINDIYDKYCNGVPGQDYYDKYSYGSVREYFRDQSNGQFTPEFKVIGPVTLSKSYTYYGKNSGARKDINISTFYSESIKLAQNELSDWTEFDNDNDNVIDMVFFVYAGEGENAYSTDSTELIWPKERPTGGTINDVEYGCYACCNETYKLEIDGIGTFCHELSHALGLADHYDYKGQDYGMDSWDIMDYGNYMNNGNRPVCYTGYEKDFMGWQKFIELSPDNPQKVTLEPISKNGQSYKITNPKNVDEYYWIDNRQNDSWDYNVGFSLGQINHFHHGLLISHVDYLASAWTSNNVNYVSDHQRMTVIPANGVLKPQYFIGDKYDIYEYLDNQGSIPFPGYQNIAELADDAAVVYTGKTMGQPISDIEEQDGVLTFKYCITDKLTTPVIDETYISENIQWQEVENATEYRVVIAADENFKESLKTITTTVASATVSIDDFLKEGEEDIDLFVRVQARADNLLNSDMSNTVHLSKAITALDRVLDEKTLRNSLFEAYSLSGTKAAVGRIDVLRSSLPEGVYILKHGTISKKVLIRR